MRIEDSRLSSPLVSFLASIKSDILVYSSVFQFRGVSLGYIKRGSVVKG